MTITEFLLARFHEDESEARLAYPSLAAGLRAQGMEHFADWLASKEARVLAECEAKRRIVGLHGGYHVCPSGNGIGYTDHGDGSHDDDGVAICPSLLALAQPYADHPDYREEWRP